VGEVQKLPPSVWPLVRAHWSRPGCFRAMAAYLESLPANAQAALRMSIPSQIPFIVLSASNATQQELQERDSWVRDHQRGQHIRIENSGHWLQLEKPEIVIAAVRQLFDAITSPG
jgi:pimeloyl-ACP methyl ester carboxylesterase